MNIKSTIEPILGDAVSRLEFLTGVLSKNRDGLERKETQGLAYSLAAIQDLVQEALNLILSQEVHPHDV